MLEPWDTPSRRPVAMAPNTPYCATCQGFGWVPWDRRTATTRAVSRVALVVRCVCNADGRHPKPTPAAARAILEGRDL